jgi:site-specific recombinase XerD
MKLSASVSKYVEYKRGMGMRFDTETRILSAFCRTLGDVSMASVRAEQVLPFLLVKGQRTRFWEIKYSVLSGFYQFAIARGYATRRPLPPTMSRQPQVLVPYIYSRQELERMLDAASGPYPAQARIQPYVFRTLLLLLYGAGLRIGEALSLKLTDVDLEQSVICVRDTKFYKSRLVTLGADLAGALSRYLCQRNRDYCCDASASCFLLKNGRPLTRQAAEKAFRRLCVHAGIRRDGGARVQPRLHDLRHTAAVHRVVAWYRNGQDVQCLLPHLATYLGHVNIVATQRYLTLTPELLTEASLRFEHYALEVHHA